MMNPVRWGILGADTADAVLSGTGFDDKVYIEHVLVDEANVDQFIRK